MPRWTPKDNQPVGPNEHIGRRIFDEPKLFGATDQNPLDGLNLRNFEPQRDREFSLDRVGNGCFDKKVERYLLPRARHAATTFHEPRTFHGWLTVTARRLTQPASGRAWQLASSKDQGPEVDGVCRPWSDEDLAQNLYHAHSSVPDDVEPEYFALQMREIFVRGTTFLDQSAQVPTGLTTARQPMTNLQRWSWGQRWLCSLRSRLWGDD